LTKDNPNKMKKENKKIILPNPNLRS